MINNSEEVLNDNIVIKNVQEENDINFDKKFGKLERKVYTKHRPKPRHNGSTRIPKRFPNK